MYDPARTGGRWCVPGRPFFEAAAAGRATIGVGLGSNNRTIRSDAKGPSVGWGQTARGRRRRVSKGMVAALVPAACVLALCALVAVLVFLATGSGGGEIYLGVSAGSVALSGKTLGEAKKLLRAGAGGVGEVRLSGGPLGGAGEVTLAASQTGAELDAATYEKDGKVLYDGVLHRDTYEALEDKKGEPIPADAVPVAPVEP